MTQFSTIFGASPISNKILFFDGHDSHFDDCALSFIEDHKIQPLVLKSGDSGNDHSNNNGPDEKLKPYYNDVKASWIINDETTKLLPHHMKFILVEA